MSYQSGIQRSCISVTRNGSRTGKLESYRESQRPGLSISTWMPCGSFERADTKTGFGLIWKKAGSTVPPLWEMGQSDSLRPGRAVRSVWRFGDWKDREIEHKSREFYDAITRVRIGTQSLYSERFPNQTNVVQHSKRR